MMTTTTATPRTKQRRRGPRRGVPQGPRISPDLEAKYRAAGWVTAAHAAEKCQYTVQAIGRWAALGEVQSTKAKRTLFVRWSDVLRKLGMQAVMLGLITEEQLAKLQKSTTKKG